MAQSLTIHQEGDRVHLIVNGRIVADLPWNAALEVAQAIRAQAARAEEVAKREQVAYDHAIALRLGLPFGLAFNADIRKLGEQAAQFDRGLRRYLPGGIRSQESVGTPSVIRHLPRRKPNGEGS